MMKKTNIFVFVLSLVLILSLTAYGNRNLSESSTDAGNNVETESLTLLENVIDTEAAEMLKETDSENEEAETVDSGILVAYFSHTGNTEEAAQKIAEYKGGTLAEIRRVEEYNDLEEEGEAEILDEVHPEIKVSVDNIADYNIIFVGYPIWWDEAPAMIATFLADNDFSGKTIIPFCTSASDSIDNSLHIFSELCPDAELAEGLTANDLNDIESWIRSLGIME